MNSVKFRVDRVNCPKRTDISAVPATRIILRDTLRGVKMSCKQKNCPLLTISLIKLTQGRYAIVDTGDYEWLNQWKWFVIKNKRNFYAGRRIFNNNRWGQITVKMHRQILNASKDRLVDHINNNGLDNRQRNIRPCTYTQNFQNARRSKSNNSGFKGVCWDKKTAKWQAKIGVNGKQITLGYFRCLIKAAKAYDQAALKQFKEFAKINFPL